MHNPPDLHLLLATTIYLMTRYGSQIGTQSPGKMSFKTALGIKHQLQMLLAHPDIQASQNASKTYQALFNNWSEIVECYRQDFYTFELFDDFSAANSETPPTLH